MGKTVSEKRVRGRSAFWLINAMTVYRLAMAPVLLYLAWSGNLHLFKWLVTISFVTDAIDGPLTRHFGVTSVFGAKLDSIADDANVFASTIALWFIDEAFVREQWMFIAGLLLLFAIQTTVALIVFKKVTSFHTYLAKTAAVLQFIFFFLFFFDFGPILVAFYLTVAVTTLELIEETVIVFVIPKWKANVKGLYWVLKDTRRH